MTLETLEKLSFWAGALAVAFGALSAATGIAAWYFSDRVGTLKETVANERASTLELNLAKQQERAATAERSAVEARTIASQAGEGTLKALVDVAAANERTIKLELEAGHQRERAAKAEHDLLELQQRLAWRTLDDKQQATIVRNLTKYAGQRVILFPIGGSEEISNLAQQLEVAFNKAGLVVVVNPGIVLGPAQSGITMNVGEGMMELAEVVAVSLVSVGVAKKPIPVSRSGSKDDLTITIWPK